MTGNVSPVFLSPASGTGKDEARRIEAAASEFEALLIGALLKSMREAGCSGWLGTGEDKASESILEIAEQQLAQALAAQGGLGLARLVSQGLAPGGKPGPGR